MGGLIDTSVFVAAERGKLDLAGWLSAHAEERFAISAITVSELWFGVHRADASHRTAREALVRSIAHDFPVLDVDAAVAEVHARLWAGLSGKGALIGAHDLLIAATALHASLDVITLNARDFRRVPGLRVVTP